MEQFIQNPLFILLIALWTLPWKGIALWTAARRGEKKWFIALLLVNSLAVLDILYIFVFAKKGEEKKDVSKKAK